jgi:Ca2+-binding RTX toxin-like protein
MALTTATFVGFSQLVYNDLPAKGSEITLNGNVYTVIAISDKPSGYQGMLLQNQADSSLVLVDRGTESIGDVAVDAEMVVTAANAQWADALALAQDAQSYAITNNISAVYVTGHSLGGTLAQLQAAKFGWSATTFNAYGAYEISKGPGINISISPNTDITNYRTLFDLVSDASTHIGRPPITLLDQTDAAIIASQEQITSTNGISIISGDHGIANFFQDAPGTFPTTDGVPHVFQLNQSFDGPPATRQQIAHAEDLLNGIAAGLSMYLRLPTPGTDLSSDRGRSEFMQWLTDNDVSGIRGIEPTNPGLLSGALIDDASHNSYRVSLVALSPVVLTGLPDGTNAFGLWKPGRTTGYTAEYLTARAGMVSAGVTMAASGLGEGTLLPTPSQDTYIYSDFGRSVSPIYTLQGDGTRTHVISFAGDNGAGLTAQPGADAELFGGGGNDTLFGGVASDTLQGGAGTDDYRINGNGSGTDSILDTDAKGLVEWMIDGVAHLVTGGTDVVGTSSWKSADGLFTFDEDLAPDGSHELEILRGTKLVTIDNFTNGDLGIVLGPVGTLPTGASNLAGLSSISYGSFTQYQDLSGAPRDHLDTIYGSNTTGGPFSLIEGFGNAGLITAGDGNNDVFADRIDEKASTSGFVTPMSITIEGGHGSQLLVGLGNGHETILGGQSGVADGWDTIDGAGASGVLIGGRQNSFILAGTGSTTVTAASTATASGAAPYTVALGGLSFWGDQVVRGDGTVQVSGEPGFSIAAFSDPVNFQVTLQLAQSDGSYGTPFGLLGSTRNPASVQTSTVPGQSFVGGNGTDYLIGNSGADTIEGGIPSAPQSGVIDAVLLGGAGSDLIYGGSGTEVIFADMSAAGSATWASEDAAHADTIYGGSGNAYIYGSGGATQFYGSSGNYTIYTGNGNAYVETGLGTAVVYAGTGNDTVVAQGTDQIINLGAGHSVVSLERGQSTVVAGTGDQVINGDGGYAEIVEGHGATTLNVDGSTGVEYVISNGGSTFIELASGITEADVVIRNQQGDLALTDHGFATNVDIAGYFSNGADVSLHFSDGTTWTRDDFVAAAMRASTDWSNETLVGSSGDDSITAGYGATQLDGNGGNNTLVGGSGKDTLLGGSGSDTLVAGSGTAWFEGGTGAGHYVFNEGSGQTEITENHDVQGIDTLTFGAGINSSDVTFKMNGPTSLVMYVNGSVQPDITIDDFIGANSSGHQVGVFTFSDGSQLTRAEVVDRLEHVSGTTGRDTINGSSLSEFIDGKGGSDSILGAGGSDTFVFNPGYGSMEINELYYLGDAPILQIGGGITASNLQASVTLPSRPNNYNSAGDLVLTDGVSGDRIQLDGMYGFEGSSSWFGGISQVKFDDGSSMSLSQVYALASRTTGTAGNDILAGTNGADFFDGKGGDDYVAGNNGADTFVFNANYRSLEINQTLLDPDAISVLQFGQGITASDLTAAFSLSSTTLEHGLVIEVRSGGFVFVDDYAGLGYQDGPVRRFTLASGEVLTDSTVRRMAQTGETAAQALAEEGASGLSSSIQIPVVDAPASAGGSPQSSMATSTPAASPTIGAGNVSFVSISTRGHARSTTVVPEAARANASPVNPSHSSAAPAHGSPEHASLAATSSDTAHMPGSLRNSRLPRLQAPADAGEPRRKPGQTGSGPASTTELASVVDDQGMLHRVRDSADDATGQGISKTLISPRRGMARAATHAATSAADDMLRALGFSNAPALTGAWNEQGGERHLALRDGGEWYQNDSEIALGHIFGAQDQAQQGPELSERMHARLVQAMAGLGSGALSTTAPAASGSDEYAISLATSAG